MYFEKNTKNRQKKELKRFLTHMFVLKNKKLRAK